MSEQTKGVALRYIREVYEKGNIAIVDELLANNYLCYEPGADGPGDREATKRSLEMYRSAFPDMQSPVEQALVDGDTIALRLRLTGTHRGEFAGMPATGRRVDLPWAVFFRVAGGKIVEERDFYDQASLMQALQANPERAREGHH
jgi:steroid delta-isomerase-like uncharacterized protein